VGNEATTNSAGTQVAVNSASDNDLANCINKGYRFALAFGAVAAVFFVVIAGYMYMVGGEKGKHEAKEILTSIIVGFLIMLSSYVLLRQINPTLVQFRTIQPPRITGTYNLPSCADVGLGVSCVDPQGHPSVGDGNGGGVPVDSSGGSLLSCNVAGKEKKGPGSCSDHGTARCADCIKIKGSDKSAAASLANFVNNRLIPAFEAAGVRYDFSDGMCPSSAHSSCAHFNGHALDIGYKHDPANAKKMCEVLISLGITAANKMNSGDRGSFIVEDPGLPAPCPREVDAGRGMHLQL
jgi:hypothetical protein